MNMLAILFNVVGGLGIFLLGMKNMSEGMQAVAGNRLRKMISAVTNNRLMACGVGVVVTGIIQSSSITTVMVVGFVNSGFMTLTQSLGVILGADIGTTVTAWIIALNIGKWGLPILGIAALTYLFSKKEKLKFIALAIMGIGMIFFGLELMKNGFKPIKSDPEFMAWFSKFTADSYWGVFKCALAGCFVTMIIQSSSATIAITIGFAFQGIIGFDTAAALVLGENIGTTITALLASLGATTNAKRAAYGHVIIKIIGFLWIFPLFFIYIGIIKGLVNFVGIDITKEVTQNGDTVLPYIGAGIATIHSVFNMLNVALFLFLIPFLARFLNKVVPDKEHKEAPHLTNLDAFLVETPVIGIEQARVELLRMNDGVGKMMGHLRTILKSEDPDDAIVRKVFHREEVMDIMQKEIVTFLAHVLSAHLPLEVTEEGRLQLRMADEYESVSDYITNILKSYMRIKNGGFELSDKDKKEILDLHDSITEYMDLITKGLVERNPDIVSKATSQGDAVTHKTRALKNSHIADLAEGRANPLVNSAFCDMVNYYRRVKDHSFNIAEALAGQK